MSTPSPDPAKPLTAALEKSDTLSQVVESAADELLVVNTVLKEEVPPVAKTPVVVQALRQADAIGDKLQESVADLAKVTELLEQELGERAQLEQELEATKAALRDAR